MQNTNVIIQFYCNNMWMVFTKHNSNYYIPGIWLYDISNSHYNIIMVVITTRCDVYDILMVVVNLLFSWFFKWRTQSPPSSPKNIFFYYPPACGRSGFEPGRDRPNLLEQIVAAPLPNAQQQVWVSRVLRDDHYKGLTSVTEDVAC